MDLVHTWRGDFTNAEVNALHEEAFGHEAVGHEAVGHEAVGVEVGEVEVVGSTPVGSRPGGSTPHGADPWDWQRVVATHSLGWVTARDERGLVGFVNVPWDGLLHAWLQDVMVARRVRHRGVGRAVVAVAATGARAAGCEWLHVDFTPELAPFYLSACGFAPARAGLLRL